jgi:hypothetical protein
LPVVLQYGMANDSHPNVARIACGIWVRIAMAVGAWNSRPSLGAIAVNPLRRLATSAPVALILASLAVPHAHAVTIEMATVGNPGNAADTTGYGRVDYAYGIGKTHITIDQYCEFLNAVAKTDTYGLYDEGFPHSPSTSFRPRIHPRSVRRQTSTRSPLS